jgi:structural maintenance of chromosome 2
MTNGKLGRRITFIPLNKITSRTVEPNRIASAKNLAPGKVDLALSLIKSDAKVMAALKYVFGSTLIAKDTASAKTVTFNASVGLRSVTLDGDVYEPNGQLSGGSKPTNSGVLSKMQKLKQLNKKLKKCQIELHEIEKQLHDVQTSNKYFNELAQKVEMKVHEIKLLESRLSNNPHFKLVQHVEQMRSDIKKAQISIDAAKENQLKAADRVKFIEKEMHELTNNRDDKLVSLKV